MLISNHVKLGYEVVGNLPTVLRSNFKDSILKPMDFNQRKVQLKNVVLNEATQEISFDVFFDGEFIEKEKEHR